MHSTTVPVEYMCITMNTVYMYITMNTVYVFSMCVCDHKKVLLLHSVAFSMT